MASNGKWLVIAEKPSMAADLARVVETFSKEKDYYESENYIITWAIGHLLEFFDPEEIDAKYKSWLLQDLPIIPEKFSYKVKKGQSDRVRVIKKLAKDKNTIGFINACDAGREGELIFREIFDYCDVKKPFKRVWLQSLTPKAIKKEFSHPLSGEKFNPLADAARCRAESDWLIGINATRGVTKRLKTRNMRGVWSIGRVQTPTLTLIVNREMECLKHRPKDYWKIELELAAEDHKYSAIWFDPNFKKAKKNNSNEDDDKKEDRIFEKSKCDRIIEEVEKNKIHAKARETLKESREIAPQLFDLTQLQREANRRFGMSASRTLQAAQRLYEKYKCVTYPRTDSRYLPDDYKEHVNSVLHNISNTGNTYSGFSKDLLKNGLLNIPRVFNSKFVSDHYAIIPTGIFADNELSGDDGKIFDLIMRRFLSVFYPQAVWNKLERITVIGDHSFRTRAQSLKEAGWRAVHGVSDADGEANILPRLNTKDPQDSVGVELLSYSVPSFQTNPPSRLTEAKLLSLMEHCGKSVEDEGLAEVLKDKGIGTPATRADIIENLIIKEYVVRLGKSLHPTVKGIRLIDILRRIPVDILSKVELTGEIEADLRKVEKNLKKRTDFISHIKDFTNSIIDKLRDFNYENLYDKEESLGTCPFCKSGNMIEGFWSYKCDKGESCGFNIWKDKNGHFVDKSIVSEIVKKSQAGPLVYFYPNGSPYNSWLCASKEKGVVFCDESGNVKENLSDKDEVPIQEINLDKSFFEVPAIIKEYENHYICEFQPKNTKSKTKAKARLLKSRMPKVLCSRSISLQEFQKYIQEGQMEPIYDFVSKKGRNFAATLHMKKNGSFEFRFISKKKDANSEKKPSTKKKTLSKSQKTKKKASTQTQSKSSVASVQKKAKVIKKRPKITKKSS